METIDDLTLLHLFHQCSHCLHASGKSHGQNRLLIQLLEQGPLTQRELCRHTGRCSATLSEQLENLEQAGYITRTRNGQDRRNVDVALTPEGRIAAANARENRARRAHTLFSSLDSEEKLRLFLLLQKLLASWQDSSPESGVNLK